MRGDSMGGRVELWGEPWKRVARECERIDCRGNEAESLFEHVLATLATNEQLVAHSNLGY